MTTLIVSTGRSARFGAETRMAAGCHSHGSQEGGLGAGREDYGVLRLSSAPPAVRLGRGLSREVRCRCRAAELVLFLVASPPFSGSRWRPLAVRGACCARGGQALITRLSCSPCVSVSLRSRSGAGWAGTIVFGDVSSHCLPAAHLLPSIRTVSSSRSNDISSAVFLTSAFLVHFTSAFLFSPPNGDESRTSREYRSPDV